MFGKTFRIDTALQHRTRLINEMNGLLDKATNESRDLGKREKAQFDDLDAQVRKLDWQLAEARAGRDPYARDNDDHDPFEAARSRALRNGASVEGDGGVALGREQRLFDYVGEKRGSFPCFADLDSLDPSEFNLARCIKAMVTGERAHLSDAERRAMSEGVSADGGFLLPTPLAATVIDLARAKTRVIEAGARTIPMDNATLSIPRLAAGVSGEWKVENGPVTDEAQTYERVVFTAKTAITLIRLSRELWEDATEAAHSIFEQDLVKALGAKLDYAALRGSGVDPEPKGILNQTGINVIDLGANGATPANYNFLVDAVAAIRDHNGEPKAAIFASRTQTTLDKLVDSLGQPLRQPDTVAALSKLVSNQVPTNLTHGTANDASEAYVADWSTVMIGVRPMLGVRIVPLNERYADNFQVGLMAYLRADVQLAHPQHTAVVTGLLP